MCWKGETSEGDGRLERGKWLRNFATCDSGGEEGEGRRYFEEQGMAKQMEGKVLCSKSFPKGETFRGRYEREERRI